MEREKISIQDAWIEALAKKQWAKECGIDEQDNRAVYAETCGWPQDFKWFLKGVLFGESMNHNLGDPDYEKDDIEAAAWFQSLNQ